MALIIYDLEFSHDWNTREGTKTGKLQCSHFTTLRHYSKKYAVQTVHRVWNNNDKKKREHLGYAVVIRQMNFQLKDLEKYDVLCRLDTGYGWAETKKLLQKMYKDLKDEDWMNFVLMRYLTKLEIVRMTETLKNDSQTQIPT
jgi:hypothetical protein